MADKMNLILQVTTRKFLCAFGFHRWEEMKHVSTYETRTCKYCRKTQFFSEYEFWTTVKNLEYLKKIRRW